MHELNIILGENEYPLKIKEKIVEEGQPFFNKMDSDMNKGWQMSKSWVEKPSQIQKCQIAADRLFTSIHLNKKETAVMMAAYIINQMPNIKVIDIDISGNMEETTFS
jgi:hypothetical protein|tara:strand:- start:992 stop:1312 length:321 start_codon:yes stop_codon:yes gene_type:complete